MSINLVKKLPSSEDLKALYPLSDELLKIKNDRDEQIKKIFTGESDKFLFIIGPCSADNEDSVLDYLGRLSNLQKEISDKILLVPRIYTGKPRTTGAGYKGLFHQPDPSKKSDMTEGLYALRRLHITAIKETGLTCADEMLYCENLPYVDDLLSYIAIGARSVEDQLHRLTASLIDVPVGMKNPTSGDYSVMLNSCIAGQSKHTFAFMGYEVKSQGNPYTHCILRGALNKHGQSIANYHYDDLIRLSEEYDKCDLVNKACIIDTNHNNSAKKWDQQPRIVKEVLYSMRHSNDIKKLIKGVMVESYIEDGCQSIGNGTYGKSITDPCLGWDKTKQLLFEVAEIL